MDPTITWIKVADIEKEMELVERERPFLCHDETPNNGTCSLYRDDEAGMFVVHGNGHTALVDYDEVTEAVNKPRKTKPKGKGVKAVKVELDTFPGPAVADARKEENPKLGGLELGHSDNLLLGENHSLVARLLCRAVGGLLSK